MTQKLYRQYQSAHVQLSRLGYIRSSYSRDLTPPMQRLVSVIFVQPCFSSVAYETLCLAKSIEGASKNIGRNLRSNSSQYSRTKDAEVIFALQVLVGIFPRSPQISRRQRRRTSHGTLSIRSLGASVSKNYWQGGGSRQHTVRTALGPCG